MSIKIPDFIKINSLGFECHHYKCSLIKSLIKDTYLELTIYLPSEHFLTDIDNELPLGEYKKYLSNRWVGCLDFSLPHDLIGALMIAKRIIMKLKIIEEENKDEL